MFDLSKGLLMSTLVLASQFVSAIDIVDVPAANKTTVNNVLFAWSSAGPISGFHCAHIDEPAEPAEYTWGDNYFCSSDNVGMSWSSAGPIAGQACTAIQEPSDIYTWHDNYLCLPTDAKFSFTWSYAGPSGSNPVQWLEPSDPDTWNDNYLMISTRNPISSQVRIRNVTNGKYLYADNGLIWEGANPPVAGSELFVLKDGLAGGSDANRSCYSFESAYNANFYIRHQDSRLKQHLFLDTALFKLDATFCYWSDLKLESLNFPGRFIQTYNTSGSVIASSVYTNPVATNYYLEFSN